MKNVKLIIALLISTALIFSCKPNDNKPTVPEKPKVETGVKATAEVLTAAEIEFMESNLNVVTEGDVAKKAARKKAPPTITVAAATPELTHGSGSSFTIDYKGQTDIIWVFHRCGNELSSSGNVIPVSAGPSFYLNPQITYNSWCSGLWYQVVVVTGSVAPDSNGVVGANWVMTYSNAVQ